MLKNEKWPFPTLITSIFDVYSVDSRSCSLLYYLWAAAIYFIIFHVEKREKTVYKI
jgi:hypothetical protein